MLHDGTKALPEKVTGWYRNICVGPVSETDGFALLCSTVTFTDLHDCIENIFVAHSLNVYEPFRSKLLSTVNTFVTVDVDAAREDSMALMELLVELYTDHLSSHGPLPLPVVPVVSRAMLPQRLISLEERTLTTGSTGAVGALIGTDTEGEKR